MRKKEWAKFDRPLSLCMPNANSVVYCLYFCFGFFFFTRVFLVFGPEKSFIRFQISSIVITYYGVASQPDWIIWVVLDRLTRAVLVTCVFRVVLGGVFTPPLTQLLSHVAACGKRHSKERKNNYGNTPIHFRSGQRSGH